MAGNPTGAMGVPDYLGWEWKSKAGIPIVCVPGCPIQPDNLSETLTYLLYMATDQAPMIPLDEALRRPGCSARRCTRAVTGPATTNRPTRDRVRIAEVHRKLGCWGPVVKCNPRAAG